MTIENKLVAFRAPDSLRDAIAERARNETLSMGAWIRQLIIKELKWSHNEDKTKLDKNK